MGNALPRVDSYSDQSHSLAGLAEDPLTLCPAQPIRRRRNGGKEDNPPSRGSKNRGLNGMWCVGSDNGNEKSFYDSGCMPKELDDENR